MATTRLRRAAKWIRQRFGPEQRWGFGVGAVSRTTLRIQGCTFVGRQPLHDGFQIGLDIGKLWRLENALKDVETILPVRIHDVLLEAAAGIEANRTTIG